MNDPGTETPLFSTGLIGKDNSIARHGIHGLYWLYSITVPGSLLHTGTNIIFLTQSRAEIPWRGIMYDYIRFEGSSESIGKQRRKQGKVSAPARNP